MFWLQPQMDAWYTQFNKCEFGERAPRSNGSDSNRFAWENKERERPMKRNYSESKYAKLFEQYCRQHYPDKKEEIYAEAERWYKEFLKQMPDVGGKENKMAANMNDWFTFLSFYEASGHEIDGKALLKIKQAEADRLRFLGKIVNGNKSKWIYKVLEKIYTKYKKQLDEHRGKGEWTESWDVRINPDNRTEGFCFHLVGCPIACHAKEHGYEELLPYVCRTDHMLPEVLHARLIRTRTEALGGDCCDYWYVGDKSAALEQYRGLEKI